ncbi:MAG: S8 family serine peptidase [Deltaproteobacteria bacterium]|jgi:MYXO-CTERM domain-containing protein|nr:S8 family serine peptidase [Deltaproteobacteria bacterium]MBW2536026.1 S8 family serine peptidase [Deltaproteobacteria bacterium]
MNRSPQTLVVMLGLLAGLGAPLWSAGCDREQGDTAPVAVPAPARTADSPPPRARRAKVDGELWTGFAQRPIQRVIVEVADPLRRTQQDLPRAASPSARAARVAERRSDLAARKHQVLARLASKASRSVTVRHEYRAFRLVALDADEEQVRLLEAMPEVTAVFADREERAELVESLPYCRAPWFHQNRAAGAGTAVAILDTPIRYDHPAFGTCASVGAPGCSVVEWMSFADETSAQVMAKEDQYGVTSHGTNVAAIALGVAPDTKLLGLNVFHSNDAESDVRTYVSDQIEALDWVAANAATHAIVAVNMSLGATRDDPWPCNHDDARYDPISTLRTDHDILTVVAAGNSGEPNALKAPGCLNMAVTVGAQFDTDLGDYPQSCDQPDPFVGEIACFSNLSGMLDLVAPGVNVDAAGIVKNGTSMAAPHVAGAIAAWQSWFLSENGSFKSAPWMYRRLLADSTLPQVHSDGRRFARLAMRDASFTWDYGHAFAGWHRESSSNLIPSAAPGFQQSLTIADEGYDVESVYLYLEVVHLSPQDVEVTLESPSGATATVSLPSGQAHFNGIIGRLHAPGALSSLAGSPADGTWTLSLRDTQAADQGNYIQAALFLVADGCSPSCADEGCGDDRCGGSCGEVCELEAACYLTGSTRPGNSCQGCVPTVAATEWTPVPGSCDDGNPCTEGDTCSDGECAGSEVACPLPGACDEPGYCDPTAGQCVYPRAPDQTRCDDGNSCTADDLCMQGQCVGEAVPCPPPGECQLAGICSPAAQGCVYPPAADGTDCSDGACEAGVCTDSCSCRTTPGRGRSSSSGWWLLLVLAALGGRTARLTRAGAARWRARTPRSTRG